MHECRQLKLLSELLGVYPIERLDNGEYAIRGIELNNSNLDGSRCIRMQYCLYLDGIITYCILISFNLKW